MSSIESTLRSWDGGLLRICKVETIRMPSQYRCLCVGFLAALFPFPSHQRQGWALPTLSPSACSSELVSAPSQLLFLFRFLFPNMLFLSLLFLSFSFSTFRSASSFFSSASVFHLSLLFTLFTYTTLPSSKT